MRWLPILFLAVLIPAGCADDPQTDFVAGRSSVSCDSAIPVCTTYAGCTLNAANYTQGTFMQGSSVMFIVNTGGPATISVELLFTEEISSGVDTEVTWYEDGCTTSSTDSSDGADVFAEAGANLVWKRSQEVYTAGDHLVEVFSDAQAGYLLRVEILAGS